MAVNIGPKIGIDGEKEYRQVLQNIIQQTKTLDAEMKRLESSFDKSTSAEEKAAKKKELLSQQIDVQSRKVEKLAEMLRQSELKYGDNDTKTLKWKEALANAETELQKMTRELKACDDEIDGTGDSMDDAADSTEEFGESADQAGQAVKDLADIVVAAGIARALKQMGEEFMACAEKAESFETSIAQLQTISGGGAINELSGEILNLSNSSGQASEDLALVAYSAISAGSAVEDSVRNAEAATKLAMAGFTDSSAALSVLTTAMNSYGKEAGTVEQISDSLVMTQNLGVTTIAELSQNMGRGISTAAAFGVSLYNLEAAYIATTKSGINTAESTTYISGMISELGKNGSTVANILKQKTGKSFGQLMKEGNSLADVLGILYDSTNNDAEAFMNLWSSQTAGKAASAIVNQGLETFNDNLQAVTDSAGATTDAFRIMEETTAFSHSRMQNSIKNLQAAIGEQLNPSLKEMYDKGADITNMASEFVSRNPAVVAGVLAIGAAVGTFTISVGAATAGIKIMDIAQKALNATVGANPYMMAAIAIASVTAATIAFTAALNDSTNSAKKDFQEFKDSVSNAAEDLESGMNGVADSLDQSLSGMEGNAKQAGKLIDRLEKLEKQTNRTSDEQVEMESIVKQLNQIYPSLNLQIDETTGNLNKGSQELRTYVQNMREVAKAEAYFSAVTQAYKEVAAAELELTRATEQMNGYQAEAERLQAERTRILQEFATTTRETGTAQAEYNGKMMDQESIMADLNARIAENDTYLQESKQLTEDLSAKVQEANKTAEAYASAYEEAEAATREFGEQTETTSGQVSEATEELASKYDELKSAALKSIKQQISVFEEAAKKENVSIESMKKALQSHLTAISNWNKNYIYLTNDTRYKTDADFRAIADHILEMGVDGADYLQAFTDAMRSGSSDVSAIAADYGNLSRAEDVMAGHLARMEQDAEETRAAITGSANQANREIPEIVQDTAGKAEAAANNGDRLSVAGQKAMQAYARGIGGGSPEAYQAANNVVEQMKAPILANNAAASQWGADFVSNYAAGVLSKKAVNAARSAAATIANLLKAPLHFSIPDIGPLRQTEKWGYEFAQTYARGITAGQKAIADASMLTAEAAAYYPSSVSGAESARASAQAGSMEAVVSLLSTYLPEAARTKVAVPVNEIADAVTPNINRNIGREIVQWA